MVLSMDVVDMRLCVPGQIDPGQELGLMPAVLNYENSLGFEPVLILLGFLSCLSRHDLLAPQIALVFRSLRRRMETEA